MRGKKMKQKQHLNRLIAWVFHRWWKTQCIINQEGESKENHTWSTIKLGKIKTRGKKNLKSKGEKAYYLQRCKNTI